MKKVEKKKRYIICALLVLILFLFIATNPTKQEYLQFINQEAPQNISIEIERVNFFIFSTYTPIVHFEKGITHLGILGNFYQISDGQYDYPKWLEFFY